MRVLVVVQSMFGKTYSLASAIGDGLRSVHPSVKCELRRVGDVRTGDFSEVDVLVVSAPTHWRGVPSVRIEQQYFREADLAAG